MLRTGAPRSAFRALNAFAAAPSRTSPNATRFALRLSTLSRSRPQALSRPVTLALARYATKPMDNIDVKHEAQLAKEKLQADPEHVSASSSVHPVFGEVGLKEDQEKDADMMAGVKQDLATIKETFSLEGVPREAYNIGMAGVLPYLGTSLSTVYCAWEINHAHSTGAGLLMDEQTAEIALHILEPLQVGYGAVIISFLGAIHWGLEWAGYGGTQGYRRYAIGVVAPAVAWPTILLPVEYALITQFVAFNFLYYTDSRASKRGWAPPWYGVYRFVLTFIVGASIVISLVGRGQIADRIGKLPGPADRIKALRDSQVEQLEKEEAARRAKIVSKDEDEDDEE
ncbi:hypothetical protein MBLNU459_g4531t1 [Dothideomycetes sp. NU459]